MSERLHGAAAGGGFGRDRIQGAAAGTGVGGILGAAVAEAFNAWDKAAMQESMVELLKVMAEQCGGGG